MYWYEVCRGRVCSGSVCRGSVCSGVCVEIVCVGVRCVGIGCVGVGCVHHTPHIITTLPYMPMTYTCMHTLSKYSTP